MQPGGRPGAEAIRLKGWFRAHRYLILRRLSQVSILALFLAGPWFGVWIVKGNLASSLTLEVLPLSDPLLLLQVFATGHVPESAALIGGVIVLVFYLIVGGRVYCGWVCPVNPVTDAAEWLRGALNIKAGAHFSNQTRNWLLGATLVVAAVSGSLAWELVNPVSMVYRGLVFGMGLAWGLLAAVFLLDLFVGRRVSGGRLLRAGGGGRPVARRRGQARALRRLPGLLRGVSRASGHPARAQGGGQGSGACDPVRSLYQLWALYRCLRSRCLCVHHTVFQ